MNIKQSGNIIIHSSQHQRKIVLDYSYPKVDHKIPVILFVHGFKGFKDWGHFNLMARYFASHGFLFVKMNFSHNGTTVEQPSDFADLEAFGHNNFSKELHDLGDVIDYLHSGKFEQHKSIDLNRFYLMGHSRGGGTALIKASEDSRIKAIATLAAVNNFINLVDEEVMEHWEKEGVRYIYNSRTRQQMPMYFQIAEDALAHKERLNIHQAVMKLSDRQLIIHGTDDETLPVTMAKVMRLWNPKAQKLIVEGANHTFGGSHPYESEELPHHTKQAADAAIEFFNHTL